uniref:ASK2 n=1 Tax=Arundo donax TaxID=35708 RepID=A0A0A9H8C6_ARUDO
MRRAVGRRQGRLTTQGRAGGVGDRVVESGQFGEDGELISSPMGQESGPSLHFRLGIGWICAFQFWDGAKQAGLEIISNSA